MNIHSLLPLAATLILTWAAASCTDDLDRQADNTSAPSGNGLAGQPVRIGATALTLGEGPQTRAAETDFPAKDATMTVYMFDANNSLIDHADYTYNGTAWQATPPEEELRWPTATGSYRFTAISPANMATDCTDGTTLPVTLPTKWTAEELEKWEGLRVTYTNTSVTPSADGITLSLRHPLTQIQVISTTSVPAYLTDATTTGTLSLTGGDVTDTTGTAPLVTMYTTDNIAYNALVLPTPDATPSFITDKMYTIGAEVVKAGKRVTVSEENSAIINCTAGQLESLWPEGSPKKVLITGTLNTTDIETLKSHKSGITHLNVMATAEDPDSWSELIFASSYDLREIYLAEATCIGKNAFKNTAVTKVNAPKATSIGEDAFLSSRLNSINVPQVTTIRSGAFSGAQMKAISLPMATQIASSAFVMCESLASICLPTNVQFEGSSFTSCRKLTTLYLSDCTAEDFNEDTYKNYGGVTWTTIHYGYKGTGDYLDPANYTGHWQAQTNP